LAGNELIGQEELDSVLEVFSKSGGVLFAHGFEARRNHIFRVRDLEKAASKRFGSPYCTAVNSGTSAIYIALKALGVGPGDEVITQAYTFVATVEAIYECGAVPIVVDVDKSLNMDPEKLENAISSKTKCIIPVHMQGNPAKLDKILAIARKNSIPVIEDSCQAIGAKYKGRHCGTIGDLGCFSLDFGKMITGGEGGFVFSSHPDHHKFAAAYHDHGHLNDPTLPRGRDRALVSGFNFRMTEIQAAILLAQLKKLDFMLARLKENKKRLKNRIAESLGSKIEFREINDPDELHDTLMFFLPNKEITDQVIPKLAAKKVGLKNVPDAMEWHCSSFWTHIWKDHPRYAGKEMEAWRPTLDLLQRCISLPLLILHKESELDRIADEVIATIRPVL